MRNEELTLPLDALPAMDRLMTYFNLAINEAISLYREDQNYKNFIMGLERYKKDLMLFEKTYDNWLKNKRISGVEQELLEELKPKFLEAKSLIGKAQQLINH